MPLVCSTFFQLPSQKAEELVPIFPVYPFLNMCLKVLLASVFQKMI